MLEGSIGFGDRMEDPGEVKDGRPDVADRTGGAVFELAGEDGREVEGSLRGRRSAVIVSILDCISR